MFWRLFNRKITDLVGLFNGHFIEIKALYVLKYDALACISFIAELDITKAFAYINETYKAEIKTVYQHSYFDHNEQKMFFNNTIFVLNDKRMIELGNNYCQVLHTNQQYAWANNLMKELAVFKAAHKEPAIGFARQTG